MHRNTGVRLGLGLISDPSLIIQFHIPLIFPSPIPLIHNSTQERVIYYLHLYQGWKHPLSGVWTLYQESTVRCKALNQDSVKKTLTHSHSFPRTSIFWKKEVLSLHHRLQRLVLELKEVTWW